MQKYKKSEVFPRNDDSQTIFFITFVYKSRFTAAGE